MSMDIAPLRDVLDAAPKVSSDAVVTVVSLSRFPLIPNGKLQNYILLLESNGFVEIVQQPVGDLGGFDIGKITTKGAEFLLLTNSKSTLERVKLFAKENPKVSLSDCLEYAAKETAIELKNCLREVI